MTRARILAVAAAFLTLAGCNSGHNATPQASQQSHSPGASPTPSPPKTYTAPPSTLPVAGSTVTMSTAPAPWAPPAIIGGGAQSAAYVAAAGLPYAEEMLSVHYHAHLDVIVNGKPVEVPPYLGFVATGQKVLGLAPLHTHDGSGIIHVENSVPATFLLGQVFVEWGVRLSSTCVGGYCSGGGNELAVFVNGHRYAGDPTQIPLTKHEEIAVEFGPTGQLPSPRASYKFPAGV